MIFYNQSLQNRLGIMTKAENIIKKDLKKYRINTLKNKE
jgi:hypothetical protein